MSDQNQNRRLEGLFQIAELLATLDVDEVLYQTLSLTTEAVGATKGSFFLLNEHGHALKRFIAARDLDPQERVIVSSRVLEDGAAGWVIANERAAIIDDTAIDARWVVLEDALRVRSAMCVPFFVENRLRGVMTLEHPEPSHFNPGDLRLVEAAVNQASAALRNAELFDRVQAQQHQLQAVLNSITEALLVVDHRWQIRMLNPAAENLVGVSANSVQGLRLDALSEKPLFTDLTEAVTKAEMSSGSQKFELRDKVAQRDFVATVTSLIPDAKESGYVIALYDVTTLKDLNRLKTHMIQMASHDLRNPLGVLIGYLDLLRTDIEAGLPADLSFIENMYQVITRMETLIATLLDSQRSDNELSMKLVPIDPYELLEEVFTNTLTLAAQHNHQVIRDVQSNLRPLRGDFIQLREAMDNLVNNAVKYTPDGGKIKIKAYTEDERFYFSVEDNGYGIPTDQQVNIFKPYFRAKQAQTEHIEGTGVGLSLVKEVVERHGGNLWFSSDEGDGSTFGFWLPVLS